MIEAIQKLRAIRHRCLAGEALDEVLAHWLGTSLGAYLDRHCRSLDDALGLRYAPGGVPWWREEANRRRDAALRDLADRHCSKLGITAQAKEIEKLSRRYASSAWRFDKDKETLGDVAPASVRALLWRAFKSGAPLPLGERQIRNILRR